jgi:hypothetical protein
MTEKPKASVSFSVAMAMMQLMMLPLLLIFGVCFSTTDTQKVSIDEEVMELINLTSTYNKMATPPPTKGTAVVLNLTAQLMQLQQLVRLHPFTNFSCRLC